MSNRLETALYYPVVSEVRDVPEWSRARSLIETKERFSSGGFADVYRAEEVFGREGLAGESRVVKHVRPLCAISVLVNEINFFCRFLHPNILRCFSIGLRYGQDEEYGRCLEAYFLVEAHTPLEEVLSLYPLQDTGRLDDSNYPWLLRAEIVYTLLRALSFLQKNGILYGDFGLRNALCKKVTMEEGFHYQAVLIDFGHYYRIESGPPSIDQEFSDLPSFVRKGFEITLSDGSLLSENYDVVSDNMFAFSFLVMEIMIGTKHLNKRIVFFDRKPLGRDEPLQYLYDIRDPEHFNGPFYRPFKERLVPLLRKLTGPSSERPRLFTELMKYRLFTIDTDVAIRLGEEEGQVRLLSSQIRPDYSEMDMEKRQAFAKAYSLVERDFEPVVASLAAEHYFRTWDFPTSEEGEEVPSSVDLLAYAMACFFIANGSLGFYYDNHPIVKYDYAGVMADKILASMEEESSEGGHPTHEKLKKKVLKMSNRILVACQGYTQWPIPFFSVEDFAKGADRELPLEEILSSEDPNSYRRYFSSPERGGANNLT